MQLIFPVFILITVTARRLRLPSCALPDADRSERLKLQLMAEKQAVSEHGRKNNRDKGSEIFCLTIWKDQSCSEGHIFVFRGCSPCQDLPPGPMVYTSPLMKCFRIHRDLIRLHITPFPPKPRSFLHRVITRSIKERQPPKNNTVHGPHLCANPSFAPSATSQALCSDTKALLDRVVGSPCIPL